MRALPYLTSITETQYWCLRFVLLFLLWRNVDNESPWTGYVKLWHLLNTKERNHFHVFVSWGNVDNCKCLKVELFVGGWDDDEDKPENVRRWRWYFFFLYSSCWMISWVVSGVLASWSIITVHRSRGGRERRCVAMMAVAEEPRRLGEKAFSLPSTPAWCESADAEPCWALSVAVSVSPAECSPMTSLA